MNIGQNLNTLTPNTQTILEAAFTHNGRFLWSTQMVFVANTCQITGCTDEPYASITWRILKDDILQLLKTYKPKHYTLKHS